MYIISKIIKINVEKINVSENSNLYFSNMGSNKRSKAHNMKYLITKEVKMIFVNFSLSFFMAIFAVINDATAFDNAIKRAVKIGIIISFFANSLLTLGMLPMLRLLRILINQL